MAAFRGIPALRVPLAPEVPSWVAFARPPLSGVGATAVVSGTAFALGINVLIGAVGGLVLGAILGNSRKGAKYGALTGIGYTGLMFAVNAPGLIAIAKQ